MADPSTLDVRELADAAVGRLVDRLTTETPELAVATADWMRSLSIDGPAGYFSHVEAFPMLALPWWMEESAGGGVDEAFQSDLAYASVSGYYFVRLLDNAMDGVPPPPDVVPAAIVFHTEFFATYRSLFPVNERFWAALQRFSYDSAATASADARLETVTTEDFLRISSRKVSGAKIAIAAVGLRYDRDDSLTDWLRLVDPLGRWHQMRNDVLGWIADNDSGRATYFLSEASSRIRPGEQIAEWVLRDGLTWATAEMDRWMDELLESAAMMGSMPLISYLEGRREVARDQQLRISTDLHALSRLAGSLGSAP